MRRLFSAATRACALPARLLWGRQTISRIELLTGVDACYAGGQQPTYAGVLVADPQYGTRIDGKGPVVWPSGYTGSRLAGGQIAVLDCSGNVVATDGQGIRDFACSANRGRPASPLDPCPPIATPWDFVDCTASAEDPGLADQRLPACAVVRCCSGQGQLRGRVPRPVRARRGDVRAIFRRPASHHGRRRLPDRADPRPSTNTQTAPAGRVRANRIGPPRHLDREPLGFERVIIEGKRNKPSFWPSATLTGNEANGHRSQRVGTMLPVAALTS